MSDIPTTPDVVLAEEDFDLDEWLSTGTLARRAVPIYNDPALVAEFDMLQQRLTDAASRVVVGDASMGDSAEVNELYEQMQALHARWEASKATWTVRALTEDEVDEITAAHPDPDVPNILGGDKPAVGTPEHDARLAAGQEYLAAREKVVTARNLAMIARAVVEIRTSKGVRRSVTIEQLRRLRARPHGKSQTQRLLDAVASATTGDVDIPRPTLPGRSGSDRG